VKYHVGVTHCKDAYSAERPFGMPLSHEWSARWDVMRALGVLATEMESAALFAAAIVRRIRAGALLVPVDGSLGRDHLLAVLQKAARVAAASMITLAAAGVPSK
jgi:uridine phosphorylase